MSRGQHKGAFVIDELAGSRFELAIERLCAGHSFEFQNVAFVLGEDDVLVCVVESSWRMDGTTPATATRDFEGARLILDFLLSSAPAFAAAVHGRPIRYDLIEDYGTGSVRTCSKVDDVVTWAPGFPKAAG